MKSLEKRERHYRLELGTRSLLVLFCAVAAVCGWFFAFGFTLGKHSVPAQFTLGAPPSPAAAPAPAATAANAPPAPSVAAPPNPGDLSAAESDQTPATLTSNSPASAPVAGASAPGAATAEPAPPVAANAPPAAAPVAVPAAGSYSVQVFSGAKEGDALSLAAALKARQYPVMVIPPSAASDAYTVQVGPYTTLDEAQAMRARLSADGYNAVIKQ